MKIKTKEIHDMLAVLEKFLTGFYLPNKVNFQNYFAK